MGILPRVSTCCCFSLRTGSLIIGYIYMIFSDIFWISWAPSLNIRSNEGNQFQVEIQLFGEKTILSPAESCFLLNAVLLYHSIHLILCIFLVLGVHMNKPNLVRYYYLGAFIYFAVSVAKIIAAAVYIGFYSGPHVTESNKDIFEVIVVSLAISYFIALAIEFYFLVVVYSTYLEMQEQHSPTDYEMNNRGPQ